MVASCSLLVSRPEDGGPTIPVPAADVSAAPSSS